jgi:hypothetical protein
MENILSILHIADARNAFSSHVYAKKLVRKLEKAGLKAKMWQKDTAEAVEYLAQHTPKLLHLHYHPAARKLRELMRVAEELNIPTVVTYHEVVRVPPEREAHVRKCLERTRAAFFLTQTDYEAGVAINPRLKNHAKTMAVPAPKPEWAEALKAGRAKQWKAFYQRKNPETKLFYCGDIAPQCGVEEILTLSAQFPKGLSWVIAGTVPAGQGAFAKKLKARVAYEKLPVELHISKRTQGLKQLEQWLEECLFAYLPNGNPFAEPYGGATQHPLLLPCYNVTHTLVLSHAGLFTTPDVQEQLFLVSKPEVLAATIGELHQKPEALQLRLKSAHHSAKAASWQGLAREVMGMYKNLQLKG